MAVFQFKTPSVEIIIHSSPIFGEITDNEFIQACEDYNTDLVLSTSPSDYDGDDVCYDILKLNGKPVYGMLWYINEGDDVK